MLRDITGNSKNVTVVTKPNDKQNILRPFGMSQDMHIITFEKKFIIIEYIIRYASRQHCILEIVLQLSSDLV